VASAHAHDDELFTASGVGGVQGLHEFGGAHVVRAHNHPVGLEEVVDRVAFLQKFGVGNHVELDVLAAFFQFFLDPGPDFIGGAHGHGGLVHHDLEILHVLSDRGSHLIDVGKVGRTILLGGGAHGDEDEQRAFKAFGQIGGEAKTALVMVALDQFLKARFIDMHLALFQVFNHIGVDVHATDFIAHFGETGGAYQADVSGSHYAQVHKRCSSPVFVRFIRTDV